MKVFFLYDQELGILDSTMAYDAIDADLYFNHLGWITGEVVSEDNIQQLIVL